MQLNPPTKPVWFIALFLGVLGIIFELANIITPWGFLMLVVAFVLLVLATMLKGM
jgi:hypothetical protein